MQRGRKKGSKNKPKEFKETTSEIRRIKKEIKDLKAEKKLASDRDTRRNLRNRIKELKLSLVEKKEIKIQTEQIYNDPAKIELIAEILKLEPTFPKDLVDLNKFPPEQLTKHIECIKRKREIK
jgi:hypothetical protein